MSADISSPRPTRPDGLWHIGLVGFVAVWWLVYGQLIPMAEWITALFPVDRHSHTGEAIAFFFYDVPKVMMLLTLIVFGMGVVRSYFSPERTRALLAGKREGVGNVMAAGLGVMTTPAVVVGGKVVHKGTVPTHDQVLAWLG